MDKMHHEHALDSVYRKACTTNTLLLYLIHREVWENSSCINNPKNQILDESVIENPHLNGLVEGICVIIPEFIKPGDKVFVEVVAIYTYNKSELGQFDLNVKRFVFRTYKQIYPVLPEDTETRYSTMIKNLQQKLGENAYKFALDVKHGPNTLLIYDDNTPNAKNGIVWEIRSYVDKEPNLKPNYEDFVQMKFKKCSYIPEDHKLVMPNPLQSVTRIFAACCGDGGSISMQTELDKTLLNYGDNIMVTIKVSNSSNRVLDKIRLTLFQDVLLELLQINAYTVKLQDILICGEEHQMPILPGTENWSANVLVKLCAADVDEPYNIVLERDQGSETPNLETALLASSSITKEILMKLNPAHKDSIIEDNATVENDNGDTFCDSPIQLRYKLLVVCEMPIAFGLLGNGPKIKTDLILIHGTPHHL